MKTLLGIVASVVAALMALRWFGTVVVDLMKEIDDAITQAWEVNND